MREFPLKHRGPGMGNPNQVLEVLQAVIMEQMMTDDFGPWFRPDDVQLIGRYSLTPAEQEPNLYGEPEPTALLLTMQDGTVYQLTLDYATRVGEEPDDGR